MTNLSLDRLKEVTGVFVSESDFQVIELEYLDYLKSNNLADTESNAEQFCEDWKAEQEILDTFTETSDGNIKYYSMEGVDDVKLTTKEFLDNLDMTSYHWENLCRSYWKIFEDIINTGNVDKQLLTNILSEETISHEQIYELQKAMKNRVAELVGQ
ncbi:hypothetical protein [Velocimicrobium porci]|uniref:Uncharacterized protein n=1 Tax=Velocimicrobium porci TaxID=2606634 RepID=A0A6L5XY32_9FIRM|nr:hypothetical protein [Velocimicrobium porci]MSS63695.1 hypothetical protein [Velocimicrobium porci]